jgi:ABC-type transport system involved in cytochrome c biogenesis permease component
MFSPIYTTTMAFDGEFAKNPRHYWHSVAAIHGTGWLMLIAAGFLVKRSWQDRPATGSEASGWRWRWREWGLRTEVARRRLRGVWLSANPWFWLQARDRRRMVFPWALLGVTGLIWLWGGVKWPRDWLDPLAYAITAFALHTVLKFRVAMEASQRLLMDRQSGAMELLLSTPLREREIVRGQFMALRHQFLWPVVLVLIMDFLFLLSDLRDEVWVWICACAMVALVLDLVALSWLGMWMGMVHRRIARAAGSALAKILVLPWLLYLGMILIMEFGRIQVRSESFAFLSWLVITVVVDVFFIARARRGLSRDFRELAANRFGGRRLAVEEMAGLRRERTVEPSLQGS